MEIIKSICENESFLTFSQARFFNTNAFNSLSCKYLIMLTKEMMENFISKLQHVMLNRNNSINKAMSSNRVVGRDFLNTFILDDGKNKIYKKIFTIQTHKICLFCQWM